MMVGTYDPPFLSLSRDRMLDIINTYSSEPHTVFGSLLSVSKTMRHTCYQLVGCHPFLFKIFSHWIMNEANEETALAILSSCEESKKRGQSVCIDFSADSTYSAEKCDLLFGKFPCIEKVIFRSTDPYNKEKHFNTLPGQINRVIQNNQFIKTVNLSLCKVSLPKISFPLNVESLEVSYLVRNVEDLIHISQSCPNLKELTMMRCLGIESQIFRRIVFPKTLQKLDVTNNWVGMDTLSLTGRNFPALKTLSCRCYGNSAKNPSHDEIPKQLEAPNFPKTLEKLELDHRFLTSEFLSTISEQCPVLTEFSIYSLSQETLVAEKISLPANIKKLTVWPSMTELFFSVICRDCRSLEKLTMHSCQRLTTMSLKSHSLPKTISSLRLFQINVDNSINFNDFLKPFTELVKLSLRECVFRPGVFEKIEWPAKLAKADFRFSNIAKEGLLEFINSNRQCTELVLDQYQEMQLKELVATRSIEAEFANLSLSARLLA